MTKDHKAGDFLKHDMSFAAQTNELPEGFIAGIASSPSVDSWGHRVLPGAFDKSIRKRGFDVGKGGIKLLDHHKDVGPSIGVIRKLETVGKDLRIEAELCLKSARVRDLYEETKFCGGAGFSVGFRLSEFDFAKENGEEIFLIKEGDLREVSLVNFPACADARTMVIKQAHTEEEEFEAWYAEKKEALESLKDTNSVSELERALVAKTFAGGRNEAHKLFVLMKACAHLVPDKSTHAGGDVKTTPPHPLLDASMLAPVLKDLAKVQSLL